MKKKNDEKKKKENNLATLIKTARQDINNQQDKNPALTEEEKKAREKPILTFKPFFVIESSEYLDLDEEAQYLAIGMINGGTIIYDLNVGVEKWILEWHGGPVTSISFYQDKSVITGSTFGTVYINNIEENDEETLKFHQSNCQDEYIPIAKVLATECGIGIALDVKGNIRLYDMIRYKKISKVKDRRPKDEIASKLKEVEMTSAFRIFPRVCLDANNDQFIIVDNSNVFSAPKLEDQPAEEIKEEDPKKKGGKGQVEEIPQAPKEPEVEKIITDFDILKENEYLYNHYNVKQTMKPRSMLKDDLDEKSFLIVSKSSIWIFRLEDVIFSIYPHLARTKRKGVNTMEIFAKEDPDKLTSDKQSKELDNSNLQAPYAQETMGAFKSSYSRKTIKSNSSVHSGRSGTKNLQEQGFSQNMIENFGVKNSVNQSDMRRSDSSVKSKGEVYLYYLAFIQHYSLT